jgi:ankyrin repeat protein
VNSSCSNRRSAFWHAARNGNLKLVRQLYSVGADYDEPDVLGLTPFATACARGCLPVVQYIYNLLPDVSTTPVKLSSGETWPPLFLSIGYGQRRVSEFLISKATPISLSYRDDEGRSAIYIAINSGSHDSASILISRLLASKVGGNRQTIIDLLCRPNKSHISPLWLASLQGDKRCIEWILRILRDQISLPDHDVVKYVNMCDDRNATPLFVAAQEGHTDCARLLIEFKADIDFNPRNGLSVTSALVKACGRGDLELVKLLLHSGARRHGDVHCLPVAMAMDQRHVVRYLERTKGFCTRLHYASELPAQLTLELLRSGASLSCSSEKDIEPDRPDEGFRLSALDVARDQIKHRKDLHRVIPPHLEWIVKASLPWTSDTHFTFPASARKSALAIMMGLGARQFSGVPVDIWTSYIIPFSISRGEPISRRECNAILPGDGRSQARVTGLLKYHVI